MSALLSAETMSDSGCEPSLLFPEMFFLESDRCFSYETASGLYSEGSESLNKYLDMFIDSNEQILFRYLDYLRSNENLSALMTFMIMTSNGLLPDSISNPASEFSNILLAGIKESEKNSKGKLLPISVSANPMPVKDLSNNFFAAFSYIAAYMMEGRTSNDIYGETLVRSFQYIISNIQQGINWNEDVFINRSFNSFIRLKNGGLLKSFSEIFYFYLGQHSGAPSFVDYTKLRELGMTKDLRPGFAEKGIVSPEQKAIASFFLANINEFGEVVFTSNMDDLKNTSDMNTCAYLEERGAWLETLEVTDPGESIFNESVKIAEQCPGSFQLPFAIRNGKVYVHEDAKWITDLAFSISYIVAEKVSEKDMDIIITGSLRSSLNKNRSVREKRLAEDILSYVLETGNGEKTVKAVFAKLLYSENKNNEMDPITDAAETISRILF